MGGLAYLQHAMSQGLGREVSMAEAEHVWDDIHSSQGPEAVVDGEEHLQVLARTYDDATAMVYDRSWCRVTYTRKRLVASDVPVSLVPGDAYDERGLAGAIAIAVPLDRRTPTVARTARRPRPEGRPGPSLVRSPREHP